MKVNYDKIADAVYIKLKSTKVRRTKKVSDKMIVDLDSKGAIVGIEMLNASSQQDMIKSLEKNAKEGVPVKIASTSVVAA